jgi:hypothetical protein
MKTTTTRTKKLTSFTIGLLVLGVLASTIGISTIGIQQAEARVNTN